MGYLKNIFSEIKRRKEMNKVVEFVIYSNYYYNWHTLNVLKECLNCWSKQEKNCYAPFKFDWMYLTPDMEEKIYFVKMSKAEIDHYKLNNFIDDTMISLSNVSSNVNHCGKYIQYEN